MDDSVRPLVRPLAGGVLVPLLRLRAHLLAVASEPEPALRLDPDDEREERPECLS